MVFIETSRLFLRPFDDEDVASLHPVFSDPETMAYYPAPFSYQQTQAGFKEIKPDMRMTVMDYGPFV